MKRTLNRIISALLALVLCVGLCAAVTTQVSAAEISGTCGADLTWSLENGVLTISGTGAMNNYTDLFVPPWNLYSHLIQRVVVNDGVTSIGDRAFRGMSNLAVVTLPASVTSLGAWAFSGCYGLKQITIPGVETIGWGCFYNCTALNNVTLPECLRSIKGQAFYQCSKLSGITIPQSVEEMGVMVFSYCKSLVYVKIRARLTVLPNWSFYGCVLLWEVYLPSSIEIVETNAFGECPSLYYVDYGGSQDVKEEIADQLSQPTTMVPDEENSADVTYEEKENATITTTVTSPSGGGSTSGGSNSTTIVDATITNPEGWNDVVEGVNGAITPGQNTEVVVQVQDNLTMGEGALSGLSGEDVTVTVQTSQNVSWEIIMGDQTEGSLSGSQDFAVSIDMNPSDAFPDILGGVTSYAITLGYTSLYTTVRFPLGKEVARQTATLYRVDGDSLEKLVSVLVDDDGMAAFSLAGTKYGAYVIALNVPGIDPDEVIIPKSLSAEYGIDYGDAMMDIYGTKYIVTGMTNELGFGIGTLTLIIVGVLVGSAVIVGVIMTMWNKQQKKAYATMHGADPRKMPPTFKNEGKAKKIAPGKSKNGAFAQRSALPRKQPVKEEEACSATEESCSALEEKVRRRKAESARNGRVFSGKKNKEKS